VLDATTVVSTAPEMTDVDGTTALVDTVAVELPAQPARTDTATMRSRRESFSRLKRQSVMLRNLRNEPEECLSGLEPARRVSCADK
jgi:hypothetical protein